MRRGEHAIDEDRLAIEDVDVGIGDLAMDEQRHADPLHRLERRMKRADVGDAVRADWSWHGPDRACRRRRAPASKPRAISAGSAWSVR